MESGICFGPGYKKELDPKDAVKDFSKRLGFTGKGYLELLEFLKKQPVKVLVDTYADMTTDIFKVSFSIQIVKWVIKLLLTALHSKFVFSCILVALC